MAVVPAGSRQDATRALRSASARRFSAASGSAAMAARSMLAQLAGCLVGEGAAGLQQAELLGVPGGLVVQRPGDVGHD
jgi:hypothetical protein